MRHVPADQWLHTTTTDSQSHGEPVGIDLFSEFPSQTSIYVRFANGLRFPARTVSNSDIGQTVIDAWKSQYPDVRDYRTDTTSPESENVPK
jgi:hypothetical protein